jgi:hypothetical protein
MPEPVAQRQAEEGEPVQTKPSTGTITPQAQRQTEEQEKPIQAQPAIQRRGAGGQAGARLGELRQGHDQQVGGGLGRIPGINGDPHHFSFSVGSLVELAEGVS